MQAAADDEEALVATLENAKIGDENAMESAIANLQRFLADDDEVTLFAIFEELVRQQTSAALPVTDRLEIFFRAAFTEQLFASNQIEKYAPVFEKLLDTQHAQFQLMALSEHFCAVQHPELTSAFPLMLMMLNGEELLDEETLLAWLNVRKTYAHREVTDDHAERLRVLLQPFVEFLAYDESDDTDDDE